MEEVPVVEEVYNKAVGRRKDLKWQGLPFLTGISPAGLLTGNLKLPEISDQKCITVSIVIT